MMFDKLTLGQKAMVARYYVSFNVPASKADIEAAWAAAACLIPADRKAATAAQANEFWEARDEALFVLPKWLQNLS